MNVKKMVTKRMIVYWVACAILGGTVGFFAGGCSPAQKEWVQRANQGVTNDAANDKAIYTLAERGIEAKIDDAMRSTAAQINQVMEGKLTDPDTGVAVPLTPQYVDDSMRILKGQLAAIQKERDELYQAKATMDENRRQIKEALVKIDDLNTAFSGVGNAMSAQLADISSQLSELKRNQSQAK